MLTATGASSFVVETLLRVPKKKMCLFRPILKGTNKITEIYFVCWLLLIPCRRAKDLNKIVPPGARAD